MSFRARCLEALRGGRVDAPTATDIDNMVTDQIVEAADLDLKRDRYGDGDGAKRDLAGDVAAMANTVGGVSMVIQ